jgi:D-sedoheptulose 7-phosphate isomerase
MSDRARRIADRLRQTSAAHEHMAADGVAAIITAAEAITKALGAGHKILVFGNGGSAADAQHFAAELMVRYERSRPARAALALTTDTSILTATGNDLRFEQVFARQIEALGREGDVALAITTSGTSPNVLQALEAAHARALVTIALTGRDGGEAGKRAAIHVNVAAERTALAQEVHMTVLHILCELIDDALPTDDH